ncbi:MAG: ATPase, T2SS/T4P/T4SS family [Proteobacteria bacterium]|nr:ATPase, T2SS/T4P/T4SS family [Pseudomonadota bacterium]
MTNFQAAFPTLTDKECKILAYFSPAIQAALVRSDLTDIFINETAVFVKTHGEQAYLEDVKYNINFIINLIATNKGLIINQDYPKLETTIGTLRITAMIPPLTNAPEMAIRRLNANVISLDQYVNNGQMTLEQKGVIDNAIVNRANILVAGSTGSGKTTLTNAILGRVAELDDAGERLVIMEDTRELITTLKNVTSMMTTKYLNMTDLLATAMRLNPDRIIVGEVRDKSALDLLKAWNTGSPGGVATIHANGCQEALQRLVDLSMEAGVPAPNSLIAHTVDLIIFIGTEKSSSGYVRKIRDISMVGDYDRVNSKFLLTQP